MNLQSMRSLLTTRLSPAVEYDGRNKLASVLVVVYGEEPRVLMTEKPKDLRVHAGEISFPGGKPEESDSDLLDTALRETGEEVGLWIMREQVVGQLEPVTTLKSGFKIVPFVAVADCIPKLEANGEVERVFEIPLEPLLKTMADDPDPGHRSVQEMLAFSFEGGTVWGASARILGQMARRLRI